MAIHELTTNAAKHGSLSVEGGQLDVSWQVRQDNGTRVLHLEWNESKGPEVQPPTRHGFGSRLLERVLATQISAKLNVDYDPAGLRFVADIPWSSEAID
jgi:two-component sensor histidine kinase